MEQLVSNILKWASDRNILKGSSAEDQAMKLFSEFGELSDNVGKGLNYQDYIGDIFVVLTIMSKQLELNILELMNFSEINISSEKQGVLNLSASLSYFADQKNSDYLCAALQALSTLCEKGGYKLIECVEIAYNDIKDRKGIMNNGVFVKESDPAYESIIASIESNY